MTNLIGIEVWPFIYLRIIWNLFVLSLITRCIIPNFFSNFSSSNPWFILVNSLYCTMNHEWGSSSAMLHLNTSSPSLPYVCTYDSVIFIWWKCMADSRETMGLVLASLWSRKLIQDSRRRYYICLGFTIVKRYAPPLLYWEEVQPSNIVLWGSCTHLGP